MAKWYDYIPGRSYAKVPGDIKNGNWSDAGKHFITGASGIDPVLAAKDDFFDQPANEIKAAYDKAGGVTSQNLQQLMGYINGQQNQALGYYKPMQAMFDRTYGQGIAGPQIPQAPTRRGPR
jgi:hypothetical protein